MTAIQRAKSTLAQIELAVENEEELTRISSAVPDHVAAQPLHEQSLSEEAEEDQNCFYSSAADEIGTGIQKEPVSKIKIIFNEKFSLFLFLQSFFVNL